MSTSMSAIYMSHQLSTLPLMEGDHHDQGHFSSFSLAQDAPLLFPFVINNSPTHQEPLLYDQHFMHQQQQQVFQQNEFNDHMMLGGSNVVTTSPAPFTTIQSINDSMIERSSSCSDPYGVSASSHAEAKWGTMPSKMKIVRKSSTAESAELGATAAKKTRRRTHAYDQQDQAQISSSGSNQAMIGVIRVCTDCNTTKTPLWRSGPRGPKSLCNACGIRQRKARRAMAAAAAAANGEVIAVANAAPGKMKKEKRPEIDRSLPFKKRCKIVHQHDHHHHHPAAVAKAAAVLKKSDVVFDGMMIHSAFPKDETTDAAILLMTLSCGLVRS